MGAYLFLKVNGIPVEGYSPQASPGRESSIECLSDRQSVSVPVSAGLATGRRTYEPLVIRERVDKSSPLLERALSRNGSVEGTLTSFRLSPTGYGSSLQGSCARRESGRRTGWRFAEATPRRRMVVASTWPPPGLARVLVCQTSAPSKS